MTPPAGLITPPSGFPPDERASATPGNPPNVAVPGVRYGTSMGSLPGYILRRTG